MPTLDILSRDDLKKLARLRLKEAECLYKQRMYDGCVYLCGYVVECAVKARICRFLGVASYPARGDRSRIFKTHDFGLLKLLAGLQSEIDVTRNKQLFENWSTATKWEPDQRYVRVGTYNRKQAAEVLASLRDRPNGVLTWLTRRW